MLVCPWNVYNSLRMLTSPLSYMGVSCPKLLPIWFTDESKVARTLNGVKTHR